MPRRSLVLAVLVMCSAPVDAQQQKANVWQTRANMLDIVVRADTVFGVEVGVSPNRLSVQGRRRSELLWFVFDPARVEQWTLHTRARLEAPQDISDSAAGVTVSPALTSLSGAGYLAVARPRAPSDSTKPYRLLVRESLTRRGLQAELTPAQLWELVAALEGAVWNARLLLGPQDSLLVFGGFERPARLRIVKPLRYPRMAGQDGSSGRVWARYVVGVNGRARAETFEILLSDGAEFAREFKQSVLGSRYHPARQKGGGLVPVRVIQAAVFRPDGETTGGSIVWRCF
jgi:hypothetical protein